MRLRHLLGGAFALLLLPLNVAAEFINVYPGPDEDWNYLYDYGEVEVGESGVMVFQIENDEDAGGELSVSNVQICEGPLIGNICFEEDGPFSRTDAPTFPAYLIPGESLYVEVTFTPEVVAENPVEAVMLISSNASNDPPGPSIPYALQGTGVEDLDPANTMLDLIAFYDEAIADETLYGRNRGQSGATTDAVFGDMLADIYQLIVAGNDGKACRALSKAMLRIDGASSPPDLVFGPDADVVYSKLAAVFNVLECD